MTTQREEKVLKKASLCYLVKGEKILLGEKKDKIGKGKLNGYGGGLEDRETFEECAIRELREESGGVTATVNNLEKIAIVHFHNTKSDGQMFTCTVHVFLVHVWFGLPVATKELSNLQWYLKDTLPYHLMMPADRDWLSLAICGKKIIAHAYLSPFQEELLKPTEITLVDFL
jgi:8-oxo-dGTP diphosphatase